MIGGKSKSAENKGGKPSTQVRGQSRRTRADEATERRRGSGTTVGAQPRARRGTTSAGTPTKICLVTVVPQRDQQEGDSGENRLKPGAFRNDMGSRPGQASDGRDGQRARE